MRTGEETSQAGGKGRLGGVARNICFRGRKKKLERTAERGAKELDLLARAWKSARGGTGK